MNCRKTEKEIVKREKLFLLTPSSQFTIINKITNSDIQSSPTRAAAKMNKIKQTGKN